MFSEVGVHQYENYGFFRVLEESQKIFAWETLGALIIVAFCGFLFFGTLKCDKEDLKEFYKEIDDDATLVTIRLIFSTIVILLLGLLSGWIIATWVIKIWWSFLLFIIISIVGSIVSYVFFGEILECIIGEGGHGDSEYYKTKTVYSPPEFSTIFLAILTAICSWYWHQTNDLNIIGLFVLTFFVFFCISFLLFKYVK